MVNIDNKKKLLLKHLKKFVEKVKEIFKDIVGHFKTNLKIFKDSRLYLIIVFALLSLAIVYMYVWTSSFSVYSSDDFVHYALGIRSLPKFDINNNFTNGIEYAKWDFENLGGRYLSMFLQGLIGLNIYTKDLTGLRDIMMKNAILYFFSIYMFIFTLVSYIVINKKSLIEKLLVSTSVFFSFIFLFNVFKYYEEPFTWFPAAASYTIVISLFLISFSILLTFEKENKLYVDIIKMVITIPLAILSMGGNLSVVVFAFYICFLYVIYELYENKLNLKKTIIILTYLLFGIYNLTRPGNFNRREIFIDSIDIAEIFETTFLFINKRLGVINKGYLLIVFSLILGILVSYYIYRNVTVKSTYVILSAFLLLLPFVVTLPIAVGYSTEIPLFDRTNFMIDIGLVINYLNLAILFSGLILLLFDLIFKGTSNHIAIILFSLITIVILITARHIDKIDVRQIDAFDVTSDIINKKYENFYAEYNRMFEDLVKNQNKEVADIYHPDETVKPKHLMYYDGLQNDFYNMFYNIKKINVIEEKKGSSLHD